MAKDKQLLQEKIWEIQYAIEYILKRQLIFSDGGFKYLIDNLKDMKIKLAEQEFEELKQINRIIKSN